MGQRMTLDEFVTFEEGQVACHEFCAGEAFATDGVSGRHNRVVLNLAWRIADLLEGTGCEVFAQSMKLRCAEGVLYPDVMVTCGKALAGDEQLVMNPTVVIEVLLPRATGYDKRDKFLLYRTLASLREFVLVDAATRQVEVFTRAEEGVWQFMD